MSIAAWLTQLVGEQFEANGVDAKFGVVRKSDRPDLGQFQCNGALAAAKESKQNPRELAQKVVDQLADNPLFDAVTIAGPGFINLTLTDNLLVEKMGQIRADERLGYLTVAEAESILVDYGGANVAKPMHVGHLRAAIIGESLKRIAAFIGHEVLGDVHLGDWGMQMGMLIAEMQARDPDMVYFDETYSGPYPEEPPVTIDELAEIYPTASAKAKESIAMLSRSRRATQELQDERAGYMALWQHFVDVSVAELKADYAELNVHFDLWLGESDTRTIMPEMIAQLEQEGHAQPSEDALIINVSEPGDNRDLPPLILRKSDGAVLYGSTDLATIVQRVQTYAPDRVLYVVDRRQSDHFLQVFRAAYKTGLAPESMELTHVDFGTMNGKDGRPFKTRAGGTMRLRALLEMVYDAAMQKLDEAEYASELAPIERERVSQIVGVAALKFADLSNHRSKNYVFDLDKFFSFEGRTGPYLLYSTVRANSILIKAAAEGFVSGEILPPASETERTLMLTMLEFPDAVDRAFEEYVPHPLCEYAYELANQYNRFNHEHYIMSESNKAQQASWLAMTDLFIRIETQVLNLLGIDVPERM